MQIGQPTSGPPATALGGAHGTVSPAGIDHFFALIQSLFSERSRIAEPIRPTQHASPIRKDVRPEPVRRSEREIDRDDPADASGAPAYHDARPADETARDEAAPADRPVTEAEGESDAGAPESSPKLEGATREVVGRLRKLLAAVEEDGITLKAAFAELLAILRLLHETAQQIPPDRLHAFFKGAGSEFEKLVEQVKQLLDGMDDKDPAALASLFQPERARKVREEKMGKVQELAQTLAKVLEGASGGKDQAVRPVAVSSALAPVAEGQAVQAAPVEVPRETASAAPIPEAAKIPGDAKPNAARVQAAPQQAAPDAAQAPAASEQGPWVAAAPASQAPAQAPDASAAQKNAETPAVAGSGKLSTASAQALARDPIRLAPQQVEAVERIVKMVQMSEGNGGQRLRVRLQPPLLGNVRMELNVRDGVLTGRFHVERPAALGAVAGQVEQLKEALREQGIELGSFQVSVEGQDRHPGEAADDRPRRDGPFLAAETPEAEPVGAAATGPGEGDRTTYMDVKG